MLALARLSPATPPCPKSPPLCDVMEAGHARQDGSLDPEEQDPAEFRMQVDFFRKLGYSRREVRNVLQKLGLQADTNAVLGELVRNQADAERDPARTPPPPASGPAPRRGPPSLPAPPTPLEDDAGEGGALKPIVIDGSNVAMSHGNKEVFSCQGIQLAVNYFLERDHTDITVFVPSWRKEQPRPDVPITDQHVLRDLEKKKILVFTPSRRVGGKRVVCYDDRFIVKLAYESGGIIVSNDTYRDLQNERPEWKRCVEEQLLMYSFVNDKFMPPDDPLGRHGPSLDNFLRKKPLVPENKRQPCPYGKKCTYGIKCKFYHPDRAHHSQRSLADELRANAKLSSHREDRRTASSSPKKAGLPDPPAPPSLEQELERRLVLEQRTPPQGCHVSENVLLARPHQHHHHPRRPAPKKGPPANQHHPAGADSAYLSSSSQERLDSGLGSYESQCSFDCSSSSSSSAVTSCRSAQCFGHETPDRQNGRQPCSCCSHLAPPTCPQHYGQPCYPPSPFGAPLYPVQHHYSLPTGFPQILQGPQKYWSDSYLPDAYQPGPQARSTSSLPAHSTLPAPVEQGIMGVYGRGKQPHWAPPPPPPQDPYQAEREEVRKKLQAIFHPGHVDKVMGMFPHILDPQTLAAKILTLKSHGGAL